MMIIRRIAIIAIIFYITFPSQTSAAQDIVLQDSVNVTIENPGTTLVIKPATIDQIVVNATSVVITMSAGGDAVQVTSADRYKFVISGITNPGTNCTTVNSYVTIPSQSIATAVTITPSGFCTTATSGGLPLNLATSTLPEEEAPTATSPEQIPKVDLKGTSINEGNLIRGPDGIGVYIINLHGYKRHIFNPAVFGMYQHFDWNSIKEVSQEVLDSYKTSDL